MLNWHTQSPGFHPENHINRAWYTELGCNPSSQEVEAVRSEVQGQPRLLSLEEQNNTAMSFSATWTSALGGGVLALTAHKRHQSLLMSHGPPSV